MPIKESAGLLLFRRRSNELEVLLAHPGGPFWATRDEGAWTIPKGGLHAGETALEAAIREFTEETGFTISGPFIPLGDITLRSGKRVTAWAVEGDCDPEHLRSNTTTVEWPPKSGRMLTIPEVDKVAFMSLDEARRRLNPAQIALLDRLQAHFSEVTRTSAK
jgi:predicted NUDIX family NTP pyrophosphohydrolase